MITLIAIILFVLFLKMVGFVFDAGLRVLGWLFGGLGFIITMLLAVSVIGFVFDLLPILLIIGVVLLGTKPAHPV